MFYTAQELFKRFEVAVSVVSFRGIEIASVLFTYKKSVRRYLSLFYSTGSVSLKQHTGKTLNNECLQYYGY